LNEEDSDGGERKSRSVGSATAHGRDKMVRNGEVIGHEMGEGKVDRKGQRR
jgi:hypothetical protein